MVPTVPDCYAALSWVHSQFTPVTEEFDDYIAKPKANGYQSLHTVVRDGAGQPIEIQIRTQAMHDHAEHGVAAHWAYKEAGAKGYAGVSASSDYDAKIAVLRQLLAWERDLSGAAGRRACLDDRIYVLTPDAAIVELPQGATAVDFAYSVHTNLGHRCRGARVDGAMVPLNTPLKNGQTVEVDRGQGGRAVARLAQRRSWAFWPATAPAPRCAPGSTPRPCTRPWRAAARRSKSCCSARARPPSSCEDLAAQLGFNSADDLFEVVGKDEFSLRNIETLLRPPEPVPPQDDGPLLRKPRQPASPARAACWWWASIR